MIRKRSRTDINDSAMYEEYIDEMSSDTKIYTGGKKLHSHVLTSPKQKQQPTQLPKMSKIKHGIPLSKQHVARSSVPAAAESGLVDSDYKFIERFNRDMMDQFMEHQRRTQVRYN